MRKLFLLVFFFYATTAFAQTWEDTVQRIEKLFDVYKNIPGAQLAISRNGQVIYSKAWGMADMEHDVSLTTASLTEAGSVSKQFTAACILLLEQQGKLSLEDDVRKYIPELPDYGNIIKLRHMMQHTSGLRDWGSIAAMAGWPRSSKTYDNTDALVFSTRQKGLNNVPGAEYIYSNSNYNLFAVIIERVSGLSLADFSRKYIFDPAGMKQTQWRDDYKRIVKNRAIGYERTATGYYTNMPNEYVYGNGGLITTAEELLQWNNYYLNGKLGTPSLLEKQLFSNPLLNGNKHNYGAGLFIQSVNGWKDIMHDGATAGYRAVLHHFPHLGLSIAWLSNNSMPTAVVNEVINVFVERKPVVEQPAPAPFTVSPQTAESYAGWYRNERNGDGLQVTAKDGNLMIQNQKLTPVSNTHFILGRNAFDFIKNGLHLVTASNDTILFKAVSKADTSAAALSQYTGTYFSEETVSELNIAFKDGKLYLQTKPYFEIRLTRTYKDAFSSEAGTVYFERDKKNRLTGLRISVGRARNVLFQKTDKPVLWMPNYKFQQPW
ncbi:MAG: serine hydrolase domain-containing protein [Chitinophagaceae bacterium]